MEPGDLAILCLVTVWKIFLNIIDKVAKTSIRAVFHETCTSVRTHSFIWNLTKPCEVPWGKPWNFLPRFGFSGDATKFVGGAAFGGFFGYVSFCVFFVALWEDGNRWFISVNPLEKTISAVDDDIEKVSCLDFDGKSVTKSPQRIPPIYLHEVWICITVFGFHTNLNWSRQNLLVRDVTGVGLVTDTLGITKNAEDETHEEWNWRLATKQMKSCSEMYSYFMCGYNWYCYSLETCLDFILTYSDLQDSVWVISIKSLTLI